MVVGLVEDATVTRESERATGDVRSADLEALFAEAHLRKRRRQRRLLAATLVLGGGLVGGVSFVPRGSGVQPTAQSIERDVAAAASRTTRLVAVESVSGRVSAGGQATVLFPVSHRNRNGSYRFSYTNLTGSAAAWFDPTSGRIKEIVVGPNGQSLSAGAVQYTTNPASQRCTPITIRAVSYKTRTWSASKSCLNDVLPDLLATSLADPLAYPQAGYNPDYDPGLASNLGFVALETESPGLPMQFPGSSSFRVIGEETVDGQSTFHLRKTIPALGRQPAVELTRYDVWISRSTYRPVREQWSSPTRVLRTIDLRWLPRTTTNLNQLVLPIPVGFKSR